MSGKIASVFTFVLLFQVLFASTGYGEKIYTITAAEHPPVIDGILSDSVWQSAPAAGDFIQHFPKADSPASLKTVARVLYDNRNIYVSARLYDDPELISRQLHRRDYDGNCDYFAVHIDSYNDNRTAFVFSLSAVGTKQDFLIYNDKDQDVSWNAIWDGKASIDSLGWTVEMKIPLSQLRYDSRSGTDSWGLQFYRFIPRMDEHDFWSPLPENSLKQVSAYGTCKGTDAITSVKRCEIQPYFSVAHNSESIGSPLYCNAGMDMKVGIGSNFTLTMTANPDFGQVEADPASVNLSANELYFSEQRPFFMEGLDILNFGSTKTFYSDLPAMIYTRRIGRSPTGQLPDDMDSITSLPTETTILNALKFSGKAKNGISMAAVNALTQQENVTYINIYGTDTSSIIEPMTNYSMGRLKKDFNKGQSMAGIFLSSVSRHLPTESLKANYRRQAVTTGADFEHRLNENSDWVVSGLATYSHIAGSKTVITQAQTAPQRYFQRPDSDYLSVDTNKTSLDGMAWQGSIMKSEGKHVMGSFTWSGATPGFEINDIGFQHRADYQSLTLFTNYVENDESRIFRNWNSAFTTTSAWNFGGQRIWAFSEAEFYGKFKNHNFIYANFCLNYGSWDNGLTRGGPIAWYLSQHRYYLTFATDSRRKLSLYSYFNYRTGVSGYENTEAYLAFTYRPMETVKFVFSTSFGNSFDPAQYVKTVEDELAVSTYGARYVFSNVTGRQATSNCRVEWIASPDLTFQLYMRPYITSYDYENFYELDRPGTYEMNQYGVDQGSVIQDSEGNYLIDPDGDDPSPSFTINNPDFNYHALQTTGVIRWEFKAGCIVYAVWQQDRRTYLSGTDAAARLHYLRDYGNLFSEYAGNVFQLKFVYWLGM